MMTANTPFEPNLFLALYSLFLMMAQRHGVSFESWKLISMACRFGVFVMIVAIISGCVSVRNIPIEQSAISKIADKQVVVVRRTMPDFDAMTSSKIAVGSMFGAIGGAIADASMTSAGNSLVRENNIPDPAYEIGEQIARSMEAKYGTKYVGIGTSVITDDDPTSVSIAYSITPLALDIRRKVKGDRLLFLL